MEGASQSRAINALQVHSQQFEIHFNLVERLWRLPLNSADHQAGWMPQFITNQLVNQIDSLTIFS
jgi:hypothetical protein